MSRSWKPSAGRPPDALRMASLIDLLHLGRPHVIGVYLLDGAHPALVDCGPAVCVGALEAGLAERGMSLTDVRTLLLTHIHPDHAGAAGALVRRHPGLEVVVERGRGSSSRGSDPPRAECPAAVRRRIRPVVRADRARARAERRDRRRDCLRAQRLPDARSCLAPRLLPRRGRRLLRRGRGRLPDSPGSFRLPCLGAARDRPRGLGAHLRGHRGASTQRLPADRTTER